MRDRAPTIIGPFVIQEEIGHGGMGVVYRAVSGDGALAAVKVLHRRAEIVLAERFRREAAIRIEHENVVKVLDAGADLDGTLFIAFELLEGESLSRRFARTRATPSEVVDIGVQACRGLAAVHEKGIIHRDLKPGNLFRTNEGRIKVLDFGIAFLADDDVRLTKTGAVIGTPAYLSPEQARGEQDLDLRTDIWALGSLLYEALVGRPPYYRDTPIATMIAVVMETCPPLKEVAPSTPVELMRVVERAISKNRQDRWPSMNAFADALLSADLTPPAQDALTTLEPHLAIKKGERRVVAVLVAVGVLDPRAVKQAVTENGGVFLPLMGNKAIGLFGGSHWEGDEITRAAEAALTARSCAERVAIGSGHAMSTSTGLSGRAVKSAEERLVHDVRGVLADAETASALEGVFELAEASPGTMEIVGKRARRDRHDPSEGPASPLVGRDAEIAQLREGLKTVLYEERALAIAVVGPLGIGKSRLKEEMARLFREAIEAEDRRATIGLGSIRLFAGRAAPHRKDVALSLFHSVLLQHAPLAAEGATLDERRGAVAQLAMEAIGDEEAAAECATFLGELLGVGMDATEVLVAARTDVRLMTDRLRIAIRELFLGIAKKGPLALLVEDLQWADAASLDLLDELLDRLSEAPFLLFATARPELFEARPDQFRGRDVIRVEPRGLVSSDVASLARATSGVRIGKELAREITERTSGNPLFVEHIVHALRDQGMLEKTGSLPLPLTVEAAVQSRLDHLPAEEKEALKRASLLRRPFHPEEIEALGVIGAEKLLASLLRRDLVSHRERRYKIRSQLVADVAYLMLAKPLRVELHRTAAAYLGTTSRPNPEEVAIHFERGEEIERASQEYSRAALLASERGDSPSVLRCSDRALALGSTAGIALERAFAMRMARADALQFLGRREDQIREIEAALERASNDAERGRALAERSWWMSNVGRTDAALETAESAVECARRSGDQDVLTRALGRQVIALIHAGRLKEAREALREATHLANAGSLQLRALAQGWRAQLASALGDLGERRDAFQAALSLYSKVGDVRSAAGAEANLADAYNRFGAYSEAEAALARALEGCRRVGHKLMEGYAHLNRGYSLAMMSKKTDAESAFKNADAIAAETRNGRLAVWTAIYRARAALGEKSADAVCAAALFAADEARRIGLPAQRASALAIAARAKLLGKDAVAARQLASQALALRDELGGVEEDEAEIFLVHAQALFELGEADEARAVVLRGRKIVEAVAVGIGDIEWRRRFLEEVPSHRALRELGT